MKKKAYTSQTNLRVVIVGRGVWGEHRFIWPKNRILTKIKALTSRKMRIERSKFWCTKASLKSLPAHSQAKRIGVALCKSSLIKINNWHALINLAQYNSSRFARSSSYWDQFTYIVANPTMASHLTELFKVRQQGQEITDSWNTKGRLAFDLWTINNLLTAAGRPPGKPQGFQASCKSCPQRLCLPVSKVCGLGETRLQ